MPLPEALQLAANRSEARTGYQRPAAWAVGLAHVSNPGMRLGGCPQPGATVLDTWYPVAHLGTAQAEAALIAEAVGHLSGSRTWLLGTETLESLIDTFKRHRIAEHTSPLLLLGALQEAVIKAPTHHSPAAVVVTYIADLSEPAADAHDVYLRLHLLSQRRLPPHGCNLSGIFGHLANVCWTEHGPYLAEHFDCLRGQLRALGEAVAVRSVDKFPRLTDYVVPSGVRIGDADRVRLGAHLAPGTTVMHEGFVNFNAGTLGTSMVEGRISAGVVVGDGTDIGGGASIMGTLSGGGSETIRIGKRCLLGANAGLGVSLGDDCTVEAGLYVTAGAKVRCTWDGAVRKAGELSGQDGLLFRRHSQSGAVEAVRRKNTVVLNEVLHAAQ